MSRCSSAEADSKQHLASNLNLWRADLHVIKTQERNLLILFQTRRFRWFLVSESPDPTNLGQVWGSRCGALVIQAGSGGMDPPEIRGSPQWGSRVAARPSWTTLCAFWLCHQRVPGSLPFHHFISPGVEQRGWRKKLPGTGVPLGVDGSDLGMWSEAVEDGGKMVESMKKHWRNSKVWNHSSPQSEAFCYLDIFKGYLLVHNWSFSEVSTEQITMLSQQSLLLLTNELLDLQPEHSLVCSWLQLGQQALVLRRQDWQASREKSVRTQTKLHTFYGKKNQLPNSFYLFSIRLSHAQEDRLRGPRAWHQWGPGPRARPCDFGDLAGDFCGRRVAEDPAETTGVLQKKRLALHGEIPQRDGAGRPVWPK